MATAHEETPQALPDRHLPPAEAGFASLVEAYLGAASRPRFLLALTRLRKPVEVPAGHGGDPVTRERGFEKLAETLLLF